MIKYGLPEPWSLRDHMEENFGEVREGVYCLRGQGRYAPYEVCLYWNPLARVRGGDEWIVEVYEDIPGVTPDMRSLGVLVWRKDQGQWEVVRVYMDADIDLEDLSASVAGIQVIRHDQEGG